MAKRFFYVAAGIFLLALTYQLGAHRAEADWSGSGFVVGASGGSAIKVWNALGESWQWSGTSRTWIRDTAFDLPVAPADVKVADWGGGSIVVTIGDAVWVQEGTSGWQLAPPVPGGPVGVEAQTFGKEKGKFR